MLWTSIKVLMLLHALSALSVGVAAASVSADCVRPPCIARSSIEIEEDTVSLLQTSASEPFRRSSAAKQEEEALTHKRDKLVSKIHGARASLALLEAELKEVDEDIAKEKAAKHKDDTADQDYALISTNASVMSVPQAETHWNSLSLLQTSSRALMSGRANEGSASAGGVWVGSVLYKYGVTQAFSEGGGCRDVPGIETVDGPAGLPDYLAYFAYQVENEPDPKQIEKVSKAFSELLPNAGSWHTIKISLDTAGNQCMIQDKMHFAPNNKMCHIGLVWSGDTGREFWIVSHNPHGDGVQRSLLQMNQMNYNQGQQAQGWDDW
jgi:hypothetical protein